ncbi:hypothetical protein [Aquamicrobium defluvii]|jgi:hypothetical protein|nr:hypothetical protein [Aquamicrobium defluvii]
MADKARKAINGYISAPFQMVCGKHFAACRVKRWTAAQLRRSPHR